MKKIFVLIFLASLVIVSCQNKTNKKTISPYLNLTNIDSLASFTSKLPISNDTIFMGFRMGMNKLNFKNHIKKLRKDGIKISYKKGINRESLKSIGGLLSRYNGNGAYCIKTGVTRENSRDTEIISGFAEFCLFPIYNEVEGLVALVVMDDYNWNTVDLFYSKNWLFEQTKKTYKNPLYVLAKFLDKYEMGYGYGTSDFLIKNNVLLERGYDGVYYISKKEMFRRIYLKMLDNEILDKQSNKITF